MDKESKLFSVRLKESKSELKNYFFKIEVLKKYLDHPENYRVEDDNTSGAILTRDQYYFSLPENIRDQETFGMIRYGRCKSNSGKLMVAVILYDLAQMPTKEQYYWISHEVCNPDLLRNDKNFQKYYQESFEAKFVDHDDPVKEILDVVTSIGQKYKIFNPVKKNPYLRYVVSNTRKDYCKAHNELFKVIGRGSINGKKIGELIKKLFDVSEKEQRKIDEKIKEGKRWSLFKMLVEKIPEAHFEPFQKSHDARTEDSHKFTNDDLTNVNFSQEFYKDCIEILGQLRRVKEFLDKVAI